MKSVLSPSSAIRTRSVALRRSTFSLVSTNDYGQYYTPREMGAIYSRSKIVFNKSINGADRK